MMMMMMIVEVKQNVIHPWEPARRESTETFWKKSCQSHVLMRHECVQIDRKRDELRALWEKSPISLNLWQHS